MVWHDWVDPASVIGGFATGVAAGIALVALLPGIFQIVAGLRSNREAGALQAHRDYLRLCFDNPEFSSTAMFMKTHPDLEIERIEDALLPETERYLWFISVLLNDCEQLVMFVSSKDEWRKVALSQLEYHRTALRVIWPNWQRHFSEEMKLLVDEAMRSPSRRGSTV